MVLIIDWFASKIGMLIFVAVILSVLLGFVGIQTGAFEFEQKARMAEDLARLIDVAGNGGSVTYEPTMEQYDLVIDSVSKTVSVDGVTRRFLAESENVSISDAQQLTIKNVNGVVNVSA